MKAIMISIKPKYCELIANGKKTIEVRKSKPKLETPFKCYIYCTNGQDLNDFLMTSDRCHVLNGKVIGEFVCDEIETFAEWQLTPCGKFQDYEDAYLLDFLQKNCLSHEDIYKYRGNMPYYKDLYAWHISDLKIYDKPKELSEFFGRTHCSAAHTEFCWSCFAPCKMQDGDIYQPLKRPPQSWTHVCSKE